MISNPQISNPRRRLQVLLVAYACEPDSGSEPGTGWNTALSLARLHDVTVVTRANNQQRIEACLLTMNSVNKPRFIYIDPPRWLLKLKSLGLLSIQMFYLAWQREVCLAGEVVDRSYDVVHQLTFNSFEVPPFLFSHMNAKKVWGPIGGAQTVSNQMLAAFHRKNALKEYLRKWRVSLSARNPWTRSTLKKTDLVLFANRETEDLLSNCCTGKTASMIDVGVDLERFCKKESQKTSDVVTFLSAGRLEDRKGVQLLLEAFSLLASKFSNVRLQIVGTGPNRVSLESYVKSKNLEKIIHFVGAVSHEEMRLQYEAADVFVFSSLRDTSGTVVLEAMAMCLPVVCFHHQGAALMVDETCALRVPVGSYQSSVQALSDALARFTEDINMRQNFGMNARERVSANFDWQVKALSFDHFYQSLISGEVS